MEAGKVIAIQWFTGEKIDMPWWNNTRAVYVEGATGVFNYGEIQELPTLKVGDEIKQGQVLGHVLTVLKHAKGRPMSMLHVELYDRGWTDTWGEWKIGAPQPEHLKDPTPLLMTLDGAVGVAEDPYKESAELYKLCQENIELSKFAVKKGDQVRFLHTCEDLGAMFPVTVPAGTIGTIREFYEPGGLHRAIDGYPSTHNCCDIILKDFKVCGEKMNWKVTTSLSNVEKIM